MQIKYTDRSDPDFVWLCQQLDNNLDELVKGKENRAEYLQYNLLDDIHDVFIACQEQEPMGCASFKRFSDDTAEVKRVFVCHSTGAKKWLNTCWKHWNRKPSVRDIAFWFWRQANPLWPPRTYIQK